MFSALVVCVLIGLMLVSLSTPRAEKLEIPMQRKHAIRKNCAVESVRCIDQCTFLCTDPQARCEAGVCTTDEPDPRLACHQGRIILTEHQSIRQWACICDDPEWFVGPDCGTVAPDICEHGTLILSEKTCICHDPYVLVYVHNKPHCVEPWVAKFFAPGGHDVPAVTVFPLVGNLFPSMLKLYHALDRLQK